MKATDEKGFKGGFWAGFWFAVALTAIAWAAIGLSGCGTSKSNYPDIQIIEDSTAWAPLDWRAENLPLFF